MEADGDWCTTAIMPKLLVNLALAGLFACGGNSNNTTVDGHGSGSGSGSGSNMGSGSGSNPAGAYACLGDSAPSPQAMVSIAGTIDTVNASYAVGPLGSASVTVCTGDCTGANALGSATTGSDGTFSAGPFATNGTAIAAYLKVTDATYVTTLAYPGAPLASNGTAQAIDFSTSFESLLPDITLAIPGSKCGSGMGLIGVLITDCNNTQITDTANLTVTVQQNGSDAGDGVISVGSALASFNGFYIDCEVPDGTTTIKASYKGMDFLPNTVNSVTGDAIEAVVRPGY